MFSHRLFGLGILIGLAGALIALFLSAPASGAQSDPPLAPPNPPALPHPPDPRWLDLLRTPSGGIRLQSAIPSLHIHLTDRMVAGRMPAPAAVSVQIRRNGIVVATVTAYPIPDGDGYLYVAYPAYLYQSGCGGPCGCFFFQPGDEVRAVQGSTIVSLTVPPLTARADPETNVISGTAPPSSLVTLYLYPRADPSAVLTDTAATDDQGHYEAHWHPTDLRPGDTGFVAWNADPYRAAYVRFVAPLLQVQWNGAEVLGMAAPCSTIHLTVRDPAGQWLGESWAWTDRYGSFQTWLYWMEKGEGVRRLLPGSRVVGEAAGQTFATAVLSLTVRADRENGRVLGTAPAGAELRALRFPGPLRYSRSVLEQAPVEEITGTADVSGHYTLPLSLAPADFGALFAPGPDGHETFARFAVPYLFARLGPLGPAVVIPHNVRLWGQVDGAHVPITVAITGPRGYPKDLRFLTSGSGGEFSDLSSERDVLLETGDILTVTTPEGVQVAATLPMLTVRTDPLSDTVSGEAPPGARLEVFVYAAPLGLYGGGGPEYPVYRIFSRIVTATAGGTYIADFRGIADIPPHAAGEVVLYLSEDAAVGRSFIPSSCRPTLTRVTVGGNYLAGVSGQGCPSATVTLLGPEGDLKAQRIADFQWWAYFYFYFYQEGACVPGWECDPRSVPILILPGDRIEIRSAGEVLTWTVPTLTLAIAPEGLTGQAPPGEPLTAEFLDDDGVSHRVPVTATDQGVYTVPLTGIHLAPGRMIQVSWRSGETFFCAQDLIPSLEVVLFSEYLYGYLHPLIPYTVTPTFVTAYAGPEGGIAARTQRLVPGEQITVTTPREAISLTMPFLSARVDRSAGTVSGESPPNARLEVSIGFPDYTYETRRVTATEAGTYTVSFPGLVGTGIRYGMLTYLHPDGHRVSLYFGSRQWRVHLGNPCVSGYADTGIGPYTLTLRADLEEEEVTGTTWSDGSFWACFSRPIRPGDRLTLTQITGRMTFTVPTVTAVHDFGRQVLEGEAPPGSLVEAVFGDSYLPPTRRTRADPSGRYGLDTSDLGLRVGQRGYVQITDVEGNAVRADFTVWGYRVFLPVVMR